jgi:chromosome segregation ATPase
MRTTRFGGFAAVIIVISLSLAAGCSSSGRIGESEKAVEGFGNTKEAVTKAQAQVDKATTALDQLAAGGDLQKAFANYNNAVEDLEKTGAGAKKRADAMRKNVNAYVERWQKEMETMNDPTLRASLEQRRQAVSANFGRVQEAAQGVREAYQPFLAQLKELQRALAVDLSPAAIPGMRPSMDKAKTQASTLKQKISALSSELDRISAGLSPSGTAAK